MRRWRGWAVIIALGAGCDDGGRAPDDLGTADGALADGARADLAAADLGPADLGPADMLTADLAPVDLAVADMAPEDAGAGGLDCAGIYQCATACDPDASDCAAACLAQGSAQARDDALALADCALQAQAAGREPRDACPFEFERCFGPAEDP
ncbi:MAG: hypothetical protein H6702_17560 [Myxococcales bacterium]|nr:hypothetical protein [Myxococcales bacterium]